MKLMQQFEMSRNTLREDIQSVVHTGRLQTKQEKLMKKLTSSRIKQC